MSGTRTRRRPLARRWLSLLSYHPDETFGAQSWFRANLSAVSTRRFHQISFLGVPARRRGGSRHARAGSLTQVGLPAEARWRKDGAGGGNRNRVFGVALRGLTFQLRPHARLRPAGFDAAAWLAEPKRLGAKAGGKRRESNLLPQRDCVYGAAPAPAGLMDASRKRCWPSRCGLRRGSLRALACRAVARAGAAKAGGELRVRTSVLADPSVFGTDRRPLQRSSPDA